MFRSLIFISLIAVCSSNVSDSENSTNASNFQFIEYTYGDFRLKKSDIEISQDLARNMSYLHINIDSLPAGKYRTRLKIKSLFKEKLYFDRVKNMGGTCVMFGFKPKVVSEGEAIEIDGSFKILPNNRPFSKRSSFELHLENGQKHRLMVLTKYKKK